MRKNNSRNIMRMGFVSIVLVLSSCANSLHSPSTSSVEAAPEGPSKLQVTKSFVAATEAKDLKRVMSFFAEDAVYARPFNTRGEDYAHIGRDEIQNAYATIFERIEPLKYADLKFTTSNDDMTVFVEAKGDMNFSDGREYNNRYVFRLDFDERGKIQRLTQYTNTWYVLQVLGR